jgi:hypothetical protein
MIKRVFLLGLVFQLLFGLTFPLQIENFQVFGKYSQIDMSFNLNTSASTTCELYIDGGYVKDCSITQPTYFFTTVNATVGEHNVTVKCEDATGLTETASKTVFVKDKTSLEDIILRALMILFFMQVVSVLIITFTNIFVNWTTVLLTFATVIEMWLFQLFFMPLVFDPSILTLITTANFLLSAIIFVNGVRMLLSSMKKISNPGEKL